MRDPASHKGDNGRILVIAGSDQYPGAAGLCSVAALRCGVDLVYVATTEKVGWAINAQCPDLITIKLPGDHIMADHHELMKPWIDKSDVVLVGPGIGKRSCDVVRLIASADKPKVIDADALSCIRIQDVKNALLTPHSREYDVLLENSGLRDAAGTDIRAITGDNTLLIKGRVDRVISKGISTELAGGNPGMTVGGTGDVLAGICAAMLFFEKDGAKAAIRASKMMSLMGDSLEKELSYGLIASDFLKIIAKSL